MESKLFGLEVSKKHKRLVMIFIPVGVVCLLLYFVLALFVTAPAAVVDLPSGGLSTSIFESQNLVYKSEAAFSQKNSFVNVPYTIDTVEGQKAAVGNANVYEYAPYYFYYSELKSDADLERALRNELTSIISIQAAPEKTQFEVLCAEEGFVNGCVAKFYMVKVTTQEEAGNKTKYMSLYRLHFDESIYITDWDILVGCMSDDYSTEGLAALQTLSYTSIGSLKLDEKAFRKLESSK